ncbi:short/branched chain specific acyl-CoA dehydrogenase, mitochondrial-like [Chrysoperla carnea]|uniref:short/branched chain specific acyl-CoA dehydrogenase, mitochondrial-like n=1 Tax=Chrysoperla carnea TaxID=189513 RepID=UPI001D06D72D|nr:short/branched chain specific acyl-CoA dehydrogenase, mitochondrial-like [Chrysoperla carnea]
MNNLRQLIHKTNIRVLRKYSQQCTTEVPKPVTFLTDDEIMMRDTAARLATEKIGPYVRQMENEGKVHDSVLSMLFENGLMGIEIDPKYNGTGSKFMTSMLVVEELSKVDAAVAAMVDIHNTLVCNLVSKQANEAQKEKYLPLLASKSVASICISEPSAGSDAFAMKTTARKEGSDYVINGSKMWISNSDIADVFLVMANAKPEIGYKGITCFIVERNTPGLTVGKPENKLGIVASGTCQVHFDNVRVPETNILGKFGDGYKYTADILNEGRIGIAAQMLGIAEGCFNATIPYTLERKQFGEPIFKFQGMQYQIARTATEIECARMMVYNAARLQEQGLEQEVRKHGAMAKLFACEVAQRTTINCIDWMGGVGFTKDFPQEKFYRDCKIGSIYEGTSNMQLSTIAKFIEKEFKQ